MELSDAIQRYRGPLIGLIASWGAPFNEAAELAEDAFAEAYLKRERCREDWRRPEVFGRWLKGVARNHFRNWARSRKRRGHLLLLEPEKLDRVSARDGDEPPERMLELRRAIDRLPAAQRQVILMYYLEETRVGEIAALLGTSSRAIEGRLARARRALAERMGEGMPSRRTAMRTRSCH